MVQVTSGAIIDIQLILIIDMYNKHIPIKKAYIRVQSWNNVQRDLCFRSIVSL